MEGVKIVAKKRKIKGLNTVYKRQLSGFSKKYFVAIAIILSVYQIWSVMWGKLDPMNQMALHLALVLALTFILYGFSPRKKRSIPSVFDILCSVLAIGIGIYFTVNAERFATRIPVIEAINTLDIIVGLVLVSITIEAARRTIGLPIVVIVLIGFIYTLFGHHLPGIWNHRELTIIDLLDELAFSFNGLWGSPIAVAASFVFMFLLFGTFLQQAGAGEFFFKLSTSIAGRSRGGAAKVAVLASAFFGSISGSPTANVVTTGSFTIPVSKKSGYSSKVAASIEAAASTGGSILPPIMGSSAFLMAAVTQLPYGQIVIAAIIPGILYYVSLLFMVHFEALRLHLPRPNKQDIPSLWKVVKEGWFYIIPLIVLVLFLFQGYSASRTGFFGIVSVIIVSWFRKETRMGLKKMIQAFVDGSKAAIPVTTACAAAGLIIAGIMSTGLGGKLTSIVLGLTEGLLFPSLILVMLICIILGMGMPVAAAYILTAMLAAPALIELGVEPIAAHLFIVYFSIFSAITPPVAVAAYAAAGIANANPNQVGVEAVKLGMVGFIVPFLFVLDPVLLMKGSIWEIVVSSVTAVVGVFALSAGTIGWLRIRTNIVERLLLIVAGCLALYPDILLSGIGMIIVILVYVLQHKRRLGLGIQKSLDAQI